MRLATYKRKAYERLQKIKTRIILTVTAIGLVMGSGGMALVNLTAAHAAPPVVVYNNLPSPVPGNVPSEAFEATSTSEFGGQVQFASTERLNPNVTVEMSSWGCETGTWFGGTCNTTPGSTFSEPITLNIYNVGAGNALGTLVGTVTKTFNIPYRPSASATCGDGRWLSVANSTCYNGFATPINFDLTGVTLPNNAIVTVAYNTSDFGYAPYGDATACHATSGGCGYDSLNVGLVNAAPSVGSNPVANSDYLYSHWPGAYCDSGVSGVDVLRFDTGSGAADPACPYQPAFKVTAVAPAAPERQGFVTGGLTLSTPRQQLSFNAFDFGANSSADNGTVEYQNFEYPGGLHYTANILCAWVSGTNARFMYQIPAGYPGLSGLYVVAAVHDGGSPGTKGDTYGHTATADLATATSWCETGVGVNNYPVTGGNAVVHKN